MQDQRPRSYGIRPLRQAHDVASASGARPPSAPRMAIGARLAVLRPHETVSLPHVPIGVHFAQFAGVTGRHCFLHGSSDFVCCCAKSEMVQHLLIDAVRHGPVHLLVDHMTVNHECETSARVPHPLANCAIISSHESEATMRAALKRACEDVISTIDALAAQVDLKLDEAKAIPIVIRTTTDL